MILFPLFILLAFAMLVITAGLFMLAYTRKEGLGKFSKIASYLTVFFGSAVFVGGIIGSILIGCCHDSKCGDKWGECRMERQMEYHHGGMNHHGGMYHHEGMGNSDHCDKKAKSCCKKEMKECKVVCEKDSTSAEK